MLVTHSHCQLTLGSTTHNIHLSSSSASKAEMELSRSEFKDTESWTGIWDFRGGRNWVVFSYIFAERALMEEPRCRRVLRGGGCVGGL